MKKINNYWVDGNNNCWSCLTNTRNQAIDKSKTLERCRNCSNCSDCSDCQNCSYCSDFITNPLRYLSGPMGSREAQTEIYWSCFGDTCINCGCFNGTIVQFEKAVLTKYPENSGHGAEYRTLIENIYKIMEM